MIYICIWAEETGPQGQRVLSVMTGLAAHLQELVEVKEREKRNGNEGERGRDWAI